MERYDYHESKWVRNLDLYGIAVGKYWELEEVTAGEATEIIGKREKEMAPKEEPKNPRSAPDGSASSETPSSPRRQIPRANPATASSARAAVWPRRKSRTLRHRSPWRRNRGRKPRALCGPSASKS